MSKNWNLTVPALSAVAPMDPTRVRLPTGPYAGIITDSDMADTASEPGKSPSLKFTVRITEAGEYVNKEVQISMGTDFAKTGNLKAYRALMESVGAPAHVFGAPVQIANSSFQSKPCYIWIEAAPEGEKQENGKAAFDNRNFITPTQYQKLKATASAQGGVAGQPAQFGGTPAVGGLPAFGGAAVPQQLAQPGLPGTPNGLNGLGQALGQPVPQPAPTGGVSF